MFESLVANAISSRLSQVLKNIDAERLKIGIWKGEVVLKDLELRTDCLDGAGLLPFLRELLLLVVALVRFVLALLHYTLTVMTFVVALLPFAATVLIFVVAAAGLPLSLQAGYVASLRISIPWKSLRSKPVITLTLRMVTTTVTNVSEKADGDERERERWSSRRL